jgi:hypothetical protein
VAQLPPDIDFQADKSASPERMNRAMANLDSRLRALETYRPNFDALLAELQQVGLNRITDGLLPVYQALRSIQTLGFLNAPIETGTTARFALGQTSVVISADRRGAFTPSPWVALMRDANATDYVLARKVYYDQASGELALEVANLWGVAGTYADVTVWGLAGGAISALESALQVSADRAGVDADRAVVDAAAATVSAAVQVIASGPVATVNGQHGVVTLHAADVGALDIAKNLADVPDPAAARSNLNLGNSATRNVGTGAGTIAAADDARITGAAQKAANLADLVDKAAARGNLGLSAIGQQLATAVDAPRARQTIFAAPFDAMAYQGLQINGAMEVSQFNGATAVPNINGYLLDGWAVGKGGTLAASAQQVAEAPPGFSNSLKVSVTAAEAALGANDFLLIDQPIEGVRWQRLGYGSAGALPVSIGFWFKSSMTGTFGFGLVNVAGARSYMSTFTYSTANAWQ